MLLEILRGVFFRHSRWLGARDAGLMLGRKKECGVKRGIYRGIGEEGSG